MVKADAHLAAFDGERLEDGARHLDRLAIDGAQRHAHGPRAIAGLADRMRAGAEVAGRHHENARNGADLEILLAAEAVRRRTGRKRGRPVGAAGDGIGRIEGDSPAAGLLHHQEREVALPPLLAPAADQRVHQGGLVDPADAGVGFALVPQHAADGKRLEGPDMRLIEVPDLGAALAGLQDDAGLRGLGLPGLFRFRHILGPGGHLHTIGRLVERRPGLRQVGLAARIVLVRALAEPVAGRRAAHRPAHQADRHAQFLLEGLPEGKQEGRKRGVRGGHPHAAALVEAQERIGTGGGFGQNRVSVRIRGNHHGHIGLAGTNPHVAHEHVGQLRLFSGIAGPGGHGQRPGLGRHRQRIEHDTPDAPGVGPGFLPLARERNDNGDACRRRTPDRNRHAALKDHMRSKNGSQLHGGAGRRGGEQKGGQQGGNQDAGGAQQAHGSLLLKEKT